MTGIIKSSSLADIAAVLPIAVVIPPAASVLSLCKQDEERDRLHKRIAVLEENARKQDQAMDVLRDDVKRAFEEGLVEGHKAGIDEADDMQSARISLLGNSVRESQTKLSEAVTSLSRLSTLLARDCVEMILGNREDRAEIINQILETQVAKIDKAALLTVELSRQDFPDEEALAALATRLDLPAVNIVAQSAMATGGCLMTLRLGSMDVGIDQQWGCLRDVLDEMSLPAVQA